MIERIVRVFRQRRDDDLLALIKVPAGCRWAAIFGTGNRVSRDELADPLAKGGAGGGDHVALGRTTICDDGIRPEIRRDALENFRHLRHRRCHQYDVGILDFMRRVDAGAVDNAKLLCHPQGGRRATETDNLLDRIRLLERQREGAADQASAENDNLAEFGHL